MSSYFLPARLLGDMGVPMIALTMPGMVMLLLPIIGVEILVYRNKLLVTGREAIKASVISNVISTLVGIPVAWTCMVVFEFFVVGTVLDIPAVNRASEKWNSPLARVVGTILSSAWLGPDEKNLYWMIPVATLTLMIPTFFLSVWIERWVVRKVLLPDEDQESPPDTESQIYAAVKNANLVSYGLLAFGSMLWLFLELLGGSK